MSYYWNISSPNITRYCHECPSGDALEVGANRILNESDRYVMTNTSIRTMNKIVQQMYSS